MCNRRGLNRSFSQARKGVFISGDMDPRIVFPEFSSETKSVSKGVKAAFAFVALNSSPNIIPMAIHLSLENQETLKRHSCLAWVLAFIGVKVPKQPRIPFSFFAIPKTDLRFGLQIFTDINPRTALDFWVKELKISRKQFYKITVTKSRSLGTYRQKSQFGVLTVYYLNKKARDILVGSLPK